MDPFVDFEVPLDGERLVALVAREGPLIRVLQPYVSHEFTLFSEPFTTSAVFTAKHFRSEALPFRTTYCLVWLNTY